jgi:hypothetical protein
VLRHVYQTAAGGATLGSGRNGMIASRLYCS